MRLLVILLILIVVFSGSAAYTYNSTGGWSLSLVGILLIVILVLWVVRWRKGA